MIKVAVLFLLAAVAASSAVPIDVYRGVWGMGSLPYYGDIYSTLRRHQIGDILDLNDKHTLQQVHTMQGQHLLRDLNIEQQAQVLQDKEVLDHLDLAQHVEMQKQKERLEMLQWLQKLQLDQVHTIDDAKMTGYGYPGESSSSWRRLFKVLI
nr:unnamed protein product [Callosobruchus analis]